MVLRTRHYERMRIPTVSLGKLELFYTHSITKDNSLHLFFHRWRRLCYFYAMTCDKTKAQILEVKITVELDLDILMDLKSLQVVHYRLIDPQFHSCHHSSMSRSVERREPRASLERSVNLLLSRPSLTYHSSYILLCLHFGQMHVSHLNLLHHR